MYYCITQVPYFNVHLPCDKCKLNLPAIMHSVVAMQAKWEQPSRFCKTMNKTLLVMYKIILLSTVVFDYLIDHKLLHE